MKPFHAHTPDAFLRVLPRLLGFAPRRCILLVAFRGNHTCGLVRFDLPRRVGQTDIYEAAFGLATVAAVPEDRTREARASEARVSEARVSEASVSEARATALNAPAASGAEPGETATAHKISAADVEWVRALDNRARAMIGVFCRIPEADSILPVVYTDRAIGRIRASTSLPWRDFVGEVLTYAEIAGYSVRDALVVSGTHWGHYLAEPGTRAVQRLALGTEPPDPP